MDRERREENKKSMIIAYKKQRKQITSVFLVCIQIISLSKLQLVWFLTAEEIKRSLLREHRFPASEEFLHFALAAFSSEALQI